MNLELYDHQIDALKRMKNGCILNGGVGTGKSRTSLAYYYFKIAGGKLPVNGKGKYQEPIYPVPLYIITTARKRDTQDWEAEMLPFLLSTNEKTSVAHIKVVVDSWNNIKKYVEVQNAFFIFDEDRVCGNGTWVKAFLKVVKKNQWILLSASPGDSWSDYIPVFIANGFYKNRTQFARDHIVWNRYVKFPMVDKYVNTKVLNKHRDEVLVNMELQRKTVPHYEDVAVQYDSRKYKRIMKERWDPYDNCPIENISKLCYLLRRVCNSDPSRVEAVKQLVAAHPRTIIFYNFDYERDILVEVGKEMGIFTAQWNGHVHEPLPTGKKWIYICQYTSAAEGWNCTSTDTIIFYSLNYSYKTMLQSAGRINRLNTKYIDLYFYNVRSTSPIDSAIVRALKHKKKFNERRFINGFSTSTK